jgi:hypothetical protein
VIKIPLTYEIVTTGDVLLKTNYIFLFYNITIMRCALRTEINSYRSKSRQDSVIVAQAGNMLFIAVLVLAWTFACQIDFRQ